jgi:hypothetical protein
MPGKFWLFIPFLILLTAPRMQGTFGDHSEKCLQSDCYLLLEGSFNPDLFYFTCRVTSELNFDKYLPYFQPGLTTYGVPAMTSLRMMNITGTTGNGTLPSLKTSWSPYTNLSVWEAQSGGFLVTTFPPSSTVKGPIESSVSPFGEDSDFESHVLENFEEFDDKFRNPWSYYQYILVSVILSTQGPLVNSYCSIHVRFRGKAYFYLNGDLLGIGDSLYNEEESIFTSDQFNLKSNYTYFFQVFGKKLKIFNISLENCAYAPHPAQDPVNPILEMYAPLQIVFSVKSNIASTTNTGLTEIDGVLTHCFVRTFKVNCGLSSTVLYQWYKGNNQISYYLKRTNNQYSINSMTVGNDYYQFTFSKDLDVQPNISVFVLFNLPINGCV